MVCKPETRSKARTLLDNRLRFCLEPRWSGGAPKNFIALLQFSVNPLGRHVMGSLKKRRKAKINKHKRRKKLRLNRHKKRTWQK